MKHSQVRKETYKRWGALRKPSKRALICNSVRRHSDLNAEAASGFPLAGGGGRAAIGGKPNGGRRRNAGGTENSANGGALVTILETLWDMRIAPWLGGLFY